MNEVTPAQLVTVIADFLDMGHVDNIVAMFKQDHTCLALAGAVIQEERMMVRMGMAVLFEELAVVLPAETLDLAVPSLLAAMAHPASYVRGDAAYLLATIGSARAQSALLSCQDDPDPQVAAVIQEALLGQR